MASRPTPTAGNHPCPECGGEVPPSTGPGRARVFCTQAHKQAHNNRMASRGKALAKIAMGWRVARGSGPAGKLLFSEMTAMLDAFNSEDFAAKRMRADEYAMLTLSAFTTTSYMDRRVSRVTCAAQQEGCLGQSESCGGTNPKDALRIAEQAGWAVHPEDGSAVCPSCQEA